jgi:hypothetical protein
VNFQDQPASGLLTLVESHPNFHPLRTLQFGFEPSMARISWVPKGIERKMAILLCRRGWQSGGSAPIEKAFAQ